MGGRKTKGGLPVSGRSHLAEALYPVDRPQQPSGILTGATSARASVHMLDQDSEACEIQDTREIVSI
jgi:hypothetical protein